MEISAGPGKLPIAQFCVTALLLFYINRHQSSFIAGKQGDRFLGSTHCYPSDSWMQMQDASIVGCSRALLRCLWLLVTITTNHPQPTRHQLV